MLIVDCFNTVRSASGWDDIGYNFLVGEDGRVYEGRGWTYRGAHAREHNDYSHGIAIMGDFMESLPLQQAFNALNNIIACGVDQVRTAPMTYAWYRRCALHRTGSMSTEK